MPETEALFRLGKKRDSEMTSQEMRME